MKRQGYTILLTLAVLALVAVALGTLADTTDTLSMEAQRAQATACHRNLTASAVAWLARNEGKASKDDLAKGIDLDVKALHGVRLRVSAADDGKPRIAAECRSGRFAIGK